MVNLVVFTNAATKVARHGGLLLSKYSPHILMGSGLVGVIASAVLACKATLKLESVTADFSDGIEQIKSDTEYNEKDRARDLVRIYFQRALALGKLYGPSLALGAGSIACILGSHGILAKRNAAVMAAYAIMQDTFNKYRARVVEELGEEKDEAFRHGLKQKVETVTTIGEDGKKTKTKEVSLVPSEDYDEDNRASDYAKFFDEYSVQWTKDPAHNLFFLRSQQNFANDLLKSRGHVFLNEVYDMLGIPRTKAGAVVGWVRYKNTDDNFIDFDIYSTRNRSFVNGYNRAVLLDFNVDGVIYDKI